MPYKSILPLLIFCLVLIFPALGGSQDTPRQKASISELTATTSKSHLIVFATLENSFTSEMIEILHSGIALHFSFFIELYKTTENWPEELIVTRHFEHTMIFDTLKENYRVTLEEDNNKVLPFRSLFEAQKKVNEINGAKVVELTQLLPDNRYKLRIKAELYHKTFPLSLHNILPFLSWWDIETDWHDITFNY